jgi:DNA-binding IclR family transcriptional regulator
MKIPLQSQLLDTHEGTKIRISRGIQSVEVGGQLLQSLARSGRRMALKDLARDACMTPAKAHPYLVSFGKIGLIAQDPLSGHYGLGPLAMQLGLISLQQVDPVRLAVAELPKLALEIGFTVSAAVWGSDGPVIIRVEEGPTPVYIATRHGTPASLRHTGTGRIFAAFAPRHNVEWALAQQGQAEALNDIAFTKELDTIRHHGISRVKDELLPGISAIAAPVFDCFGRLVLAIAAMGPTAQLQVEANSPHEKLLLQLSEKLSLRLGASPQLYRSDRQKPQV